MVDIRTIEIDEIAQIGARLFEANNQETGTPELGFEVDVAQLRAIEANGCLLITGAFDGDTLVGYCGTIIAPHPFTPKIIATCVALYLDPVRRGFVGGRLMIEAKRESARRGAARFRWGARVGTQFHEFMSRRHDIMESVFEEQL